MPEALEGYLVIDKPAGITSFGCVRRVRHILKEKHVGHCGTLDPLARGVLIILVGKACRQQERFLSLEKQYWMRGELGRSTTTGDREGDVVESRPHGHVEEQHLIAAMNRFLGPISQVPPRYAALKYKGRPYYDYARKGEEIPRIPRIVTIHSMTLLSFCSPYWESRVVCSRGTYIRTLAEDLGAALGTVATLDDLVRERVGELDQAHALPWSLIENSSPISLAAHLAPVESAFNTLAHA